MGRIDTHIHYIPDLYREALGDAEFGAFQLPPWSPELLLGFMDDHEIDVAVLSLTPPGAYLGDQGRARELARAINEGLADLVGSNPERFRGLASLPLPDVDDALVEFRHAIDVLELDGLALLSSVDGIYCGAPAWDPLFDEMDRRGTYAFIHPNKPKADLTPEIPVFLQDFPFDTTRAITQLIFGGTMERCQNLRLQVGHLGGTAPFLAHRYELLANYDPSSVDRAPAGALDYLSRFYYDTGLSGNEHAFETTNRVAPIEQIVFGSDWPYAVVPEKGDPQPGLGFLDEEARRKVDRENAAALLA